MCARLKADDEHISHSHPYFQGISRRNVLIGLAGLGGGYWLWTNRHSVARWITNFLNGVRNKPSGGFAGGVQVANVEDIREARMRRFESIALPVVDNFDVSFNDKTS
jgi:hypothetical protein